MLERNEKGKLVFKSLDMEIFIGDLFEQCKTEHEVQWLQEQLQGIIECCADEQLEDIER